MRKSYKCNVFVYDLLGMAGFRLPHKTRFSVKDDNKLDTDFSDDYIPTAEDWGNEDSNVPYRMIAYPKPGDVVAYVHGPGGLGAGYTGHVGIHSYPQDARQEITLKAGDVNISLEMQRQLISADDDAIYENIRIWRKYDEDYNLTVSRTFFRRIK